MESWRTNPNARHEIETLPGGKLLEKIYGATKRTKLFVSPAKISIRYKIGLDIVAEPRIDSFLLKVAAAVHCEKTVRGHLGIHRQTDTYYIVLQDESGAYSLRAAETDFGLLSHKTVL